MQSGGVIGFRIQPGLPSGQKAETAAKPGFCNHKMTAGRDTRETFCELVVPDKDVPAFFQSIFPAEINVSKFLGDRHTVLPNQRGRFNLWRVNAVGHKPDALPGYLAGAASSTETLSIIMFFTGTSDIPRECPVGTLAIASITPIPSVTLPKTAYPASLELAFRKSLSTRLMKNCDVAESGALVRAMAIVPRRLGRLAVASFTTGASVCLRTRPDSNPPP